MACVSLENQPLKNKPPTKKIIVQILAWDLVVMGIRMAVTLSLNQAAVGVGPNIAPPDQVYDACILHRQLHGHRCGC